MKLHSYAIREALVEGRHMDAARLLAWHNCVEMGLEQEEIKIMHNHHTDYAIRIRIGRCGFEWEAGKFHSLYSLAHSGNPTSREIIIWSPHENL